MSEESGVLIAVLSSAAGGAAAVATRYLVPHADPFTLAALRFGGGALCLVPLALLTGAIWPARRDWPAVAGLGFMFFGVFFVFYNLALAYTTVARGTLALSTLPLLTMAAGALLRIEPLSLGKAMGVLVAMTGVAFALGTELDNALVGAWRGDLIMVAATVCMALYNVWSRPFIRRSSALGFVASGMSVGGGALVCVALATGGAARLHQFSPADWSAALYMALGGGALAFLLWVMALERASPTRVAATMTVNPIVAGLLAALILGEPLTLNLLIGLIAVAFGLMLASLANVRVALPRG